MPVDPSAVLRRVPNTASPVELEAQPKALRELRVRRASDITPTRVAWLWPGWLPASRLALVGGKPGDGKSSVTTDLAARLSTAGPMPDGYRPAEPVNVGILSAEDGADDTLVPRLIVAGANLDRVFVIGGIVNDLGIERPWILPDDLLELAEFVRRNDVRLLVIDPLSAFQSAQVDTHRDGAVRAMLLPLSNMASQLSCAVLAVRHHRKGGATDARDAGSGSIAFTAAARIEWAVGTDPHDGTRRIIAVSKSNIAAVPSSIAYRLTQDDEWQTNRIVWDGESDVTANQLVAEPSSEEDRSVVDEAVEFLSATLGDGALPAKTVERQSRDAGISYPALRRAKQRLKVRSRKTALGAWVWELRDQGAHGAGEGAQQSEHASLERLERLEHVPSTHTLNHEGFSREAVEGAQGAQDDRGGLHEHLPSDEYLDEPPDDETLARWADEAESLRGEEA